MLAAAVEAELPVAQVFHTQDAPLPEWIERRLAASAEIFSVEQRTLASLAQTKTPQGAVAVLPFLDRKLEDLAGLLSPDRPALVLVLHDLSDPGNAGTLLRSAEAFGAAAVCFGAHAVEPYNDKVVRASMGSLLRIPIVRYGEWPEFRSSAVESGLQLVAADAAGQDVRAVTVPRRVALLIGQERRGVRDVPAQDLHATVALPQRESVESVNAAVAGSILLYEFARAQGLL